MLNSLYTEYFQKSKAFLYPLLGISKRTGIAPVMTYIELNDLYTSKDMNLICEFHLGQDYSYRNFEKSKILNHYLFKEFYKTEKGTGLYIFDLYKFKEEWLLFLEGKYSKFDDASKGYIYNYHQGNKYHSTYIDSYLNPNEYYEDYARLLGCDVQILKSVGELCDRPDFKKEKLVIDLKPITLPKTIKN